MAAMVQLAPYDTGFLAQHFGMRTRVMQHDVAATAYVGPEGRIDYPRRGTGKDGKSKGRTVSVETVARWAEFGTTKQGKNPFMTRAFEMEKQGAMDAMIEEIRKAIEEETK